MSDRQFLIILFVLVFWLIYFIHWSSAYTTSEEELTYTTTEITDVLCKTSFMCQYKKNVVDVFTELIDRVEKEQKENQEQWEKEKKIKDEGSLVPFPV